VSHYVDSALAYQDVRLNITNLYVFRGEVGTVFVMSVNNSAAGGTPGGFQPDAHYDFHVDADGDAVEDLTYRVLFGEHDRAGRQALALYQLVGAEAGVHTAPGALLAWGSTETAVAGAQGLRLWAGLAAESSWVEPTVLAAIRRALRFGRKVELAGWHPRRAVNAFAGTTVYALVLEVPDDVIAGSLGSRREIGFWGTTTLATDAGGWRPVDRMGLPMVQSLFNHGEDERASDYNTTHPADDRANYGELFAGLVAGLVAAHETADDPRAYGCIVARLLLPDILTYRVGSAASYSFACHNGRGLSDNVPEVMFSLVTNRALSDGLSKRHVAGKPRPHFPYVPSPPVAHRTTAVSPRRKPGAH
jgi:hypothetical protein